MEILPPDNSNGDTGGPLFDGSGPFLGGGPGGPPPGDAIFETFSADDESPTETPDTAPSEDPSLTVGLRFFDDMNNLRP
ncbi:MAG: hypothetical protein AAB692_03355 [Patescibacteria group bacterium]